MLGRLRSCSQTGRLYYNHETPIPGPNRDLDPCQNLCHFLIHSFLPTLHLKTIRERQMYWIPQLTKMADNLLPLQHFTPQYQALHCSTLPPSTLSDFYHKMAALLGHFNILPDKLHSPQLTNFCSHFDSTLSPPKHKAGKLLD